jgi:hypothetical protein
MIIRVSSGFNTTTTLKTIQSINYGYYKTMQKGNGYACAVATIK